MYLKVLSPRCSLFVHVSLLDFIVLQKFGEIVSTDTTSGELNVQEMVLSPFSHKTVDGVNIPFTDVGIFKGPPNYLSHYHRLHANDVLGKVVVTNEYAVCVPKDLLLDGYF